jgi:uncharacterized circularly permuted ATP-grasp superfamily protein
LNNLPKLIIKKTNRDLGFKSVYGRKLNKEQLKDQSTKQSKRICGSRGRSLSTPSLIDGKILPRLAVIRLLISDGSYKVKGLTVVQLSKIVSNFESI